MVRRVSEEVGRAKVRFEYGFLDVYTFYRYVGSLRVVSLLRGL